MTGDATAILRLDGRPVAEYVWGPDLPAALSPRPYLHPVRTLGGTTVTELMPPSHRHHLGVSVAVAEVDGANFWGGRTFIPGHGPAWPDNQGSQEHVRWLHRTDTRLSHTLRWVTIDGRPLLTERRDLSCRLAGPGAWALDFGFALTNITGETLPVRSPSTLGRTGAGYGGFFWRAARPGEDCQIRTGRGTGLATAYGQPADWMTVAGDEWSLVFIPVGEQTRADPWFVRTRDYLGVGSVLAWTEPLLLAPGETATRRIVTVIADGAVDDARAAWFAAELTPSAAETLS